MIRPRYLAVIPKEGRSCDSRRSRFLDVASSIEPMQIIADRPDLLLAAQDVGPSLVGGRSGFLIGSVFCRGRRGAQRELSRETQTLAANSRGEHLIRAYWGGYVAFFLAEGRHCIDVLRAPLGDLACLYWCGSDSIVIASDVALLTRFAGVPPQIDPVTLARYLLAEDLHGAETCLSGVAELRGGQRLTIENGSVTSTPLWSPWSFAAAERRITDAADAAARVHDVVRHCVGAVATKVDHVVLRLSGGLDSSIVAAALAEEKRPFTCLNLVTRNPSGDERRYAARVAEAFAAPLAIRLRKLERINLGRSDAATLPRPTARIFAQETRRLTEEVAEESGSGIALDGGGGDNVFCSLKSARVLADCMMDEAGRSYFWPTLRSTALLAQVSVLQVLRRAIGIRWRRSPGFHYRADRRFLSTDAVGQSASAIVHPWLDAAPDALPGKAAQVSLLVAAQSVAEGFDPQAALALYSPLVAQPVVETCLRVPTWLWFDKSLDRATARRAFSTALPSDIITRSSKGTPDSFLIEIYEAHRAAIREMLLGGVLSSARLLDRAALDRALAPAGPVTGHDYFRIMRLVDAEVWARAH